MQRPLVLAPRDVMLRPLVLAPRDVVLRLLAPAPGEIVLRPQVLDGTRADAPLQPLSEKGQ